MHSFPNTHEMFVLECKSANIVSVSLIRPRTLVSFLNYLETLATCAIAMNLVDNQVVFLKDYYKSKVIGGTHACKNLSLTLKLERLGTDISYNVSLLKRYLESGRTHPMKHLV